MFESWYREHYHEMSGAGRWFSGCGFNLLPPESWETRRYRILIVRLSTSRDTADSFTHRLLYQIAAGIGGVFADCAWLPPPEDGALFESHGVPWLTGAVTKRPASDFDCIAFSNSILQELINLPVMLDKSGISADKRKRLECAWVPLIILGGANAPFTSFLLGEDSPVDLIFAGEDPDSIIDIFTLCRDAKTAEKPKTGVIEALRAIPGIIEPDHPARTARTASVPDRGRQPCNAPVFAGEGNAGTGFLQISEGCPCFCSFCAESWSRRPYRETEIGTCIAAAKEMKASQGLERIEICSFNFNMHSRFDDLLRNLAELYPSLGLKSQRIDAIGENPGLLDLELAAGKSSFTVGIEGISPRLRSRLQKSLDEAKLRSGLGRILDAPVRELKLFFLATGYEEPEDFDGFRDLLAFISETMRSVRRLPRVIVSMTPLVRFPFTPLETEPAPDSGELRNIILQCERLTRAKRFEFRTAASLNDFLVSQMIARSTDPRIRKAFGEAVSETGFVYYRDISDRFLAALAAALARNGLEARETLMGIDPSRRMPLEPAAADTFLSSVGKSAGLFSDIGHCLGTISGEGTCRGCGACEDKGWRAAITGRRGKTAFKAERLKALFREYGRTRSLGIGVTIGPDYRGTPRAFIAAAIARALMREVPSLVREYRGFGGTLVGDRFRSDWIAGDEIFILNFLEFPETPLEKLCGDASLLRKLDTGMERKLGFTEIRSDQPQRQDVSLVFRIPYRFDPVRFLNVNAIGNTIHRIGEEALEYRVAAGALRKKIVRSIRVRREGNESEVEVETGEKFDYPAFVHSTIDLPDDRHIVRIQCTAQLFTCLKTP